MFAGVLFGILFVKNLKWERWEKYVWWVSLCVSGILVVFAALFNVFYVGHYPPTDWRACCPFPDYLHRPSSLTLSTTSYSTQSVALLAAESGSTASSLA